jgi:hypothetical protein
MKCGGSKPTTYIYGIKLIVMITFEQLKGILCQGEVEIQYDNEVPDSVIGETENKFERANTLLDLVNIYEDMGYETHTAHEVIVNTMMQLATLD